MLKTLALLVPASLAAAALLTACMSHAGHDMQDHAQHGTPDVMDREPSTASWTPATLEDLDPAADVVEVNLVARVATVPLLDGRPATLWTYNGTLPGPLLEARVGDTIVVNFTNHLPEPTTIHWHGLRLPADMDGMTPVPAGGTFQYRFTARDEGTFWYHPHIRSEDQVRQGLYGAMVIHGPVEAALPAGRVVVLSDMLVDAQGALVTPADDMATQMLGVQGNLLLVNGVARPILDVRSGAWTRLRLINAAPSRYFRLSLPGHRFHRVGEDGAMLETPVASDELLLVPGQRADVMVEATGAPGSTLDLLALPYERGHNSGGGDAVKILHVRHGMDTPLQPTALPTTLGTVETMAPPATLRTIRLGESMGHGGHAGHGGDTAGGMVFTINGQAHPDVPVITSTLDAEETWDVVNETEMDHPFHLHGFHFQVLQQGGVAPSHRAWLDTVNIPANTTVKLGVRLQGFAGTWMYHCHILGHAERGMMGELVVNP